MRLRVPSYTWLYVATGRESKGTSTIIDHNLYDWYGLALRVRRDKSRKNPKRWGLRFRFGSSWLLFIISYLLFAETVNTYALRAREAQERRSIVVREAAWQKIWSLLFTTKQKDWEVLAATSRNVIGNCRTHSNAAFRRGTCGKTWGPGSGSPLYSLYTLSVLKLG
jgi:hypothetical protein